MVEFAVRDTYRRVLVVCVDNYAANAKCETTPLTRADTFTADSAE
jgi:hypothetical protein